MKVSSIARQIYAETVEKQGCSMNLDGQIPVKGYMVELYATETKINIFDFKPEDIDLFIHKRYNGIAHQAGPFRISIQNRNFDGLVFGFF